MLARPAEAEQDRCCACVRRRAYLARRHTLSDRIPKEVSGFESLSSSAVTLETMRLVSSPAPFGNMPPAVQYGPGAGSQLIRDRIQPE